jgi:hypothetical protein
MRCTIALLGVLAGCDPAGAADGDERLELRLDDFALPTDATTYACRRFELPVDGPRDVVAFTPLIEDWQHVHHMILYRVDAVVDDGELCYPSPLDPWVVWGWAPGGLPLELPQDVGIAIDPDHDRFVLQVHYDNPLGDEGVVDASGVELQLDEPRSIRASVFGLGTVETLAIPAGVADYPVRATCSAETTNALLPEPVHVFGSWLHGHEIASALWTEHWRDGVMLGELDRADPYDFGDQRFMPVDAVVQPGDELVTHCRFDSTARTEPTLGGPSSQDEMCLDFLLYWPATDFGYCYDGP